MSESKKWEEGYHIKIRLGIEDIAQMDKSLSNSDCIMVLALLQRSDPSIYLKVVNMAIESLKYAGVIK